MKQILLAPSLLAGNHARLADSMSEMEAVSGVRWAHIDIMDGHFVPNLTFGPQTVKDLRPHSRLFFDVHLMLDEPHRYAAAFIDAGAQNVTIHVEPDYPIGETLRDIRARGSQCGICLNPDTPVKAVEPYLDQVDLVLAMTVQPGFGGQQFRHDVLDKIAELNALRVRHQLDWRLEVDGGVDAVTGPECLRAGADTLVAGTAFFKAPDRAAFVKSLQPEPI